MSRQLRLVSQMNKRITQMIFACDSQISKTYYSSTNNDEKRFKLKKWDFSPMTLMIVGGTFYLGWKGLYGTKRGPSEFQIECVPQRVVSDAPRIITAEELSQHRNVEDGGVWVSYRGKVYDVTDFVSMHPGGDKILLAAGGDVAPFWSIYAFHYEKHVTDMLKEYYIGDLAVTSSTEDDLIKEGPYANDPERHPALIIVSQAPFNAETPPELIPDHPITPNQLFFVRTHLPVPDIKADAYELEISSSSSVQRRDKFTLNLNKLMTEFTSHKIISTMICAGNRRSDMAQEDLIASKAEGRQQIIRGLPWRHSAISTAEWTGVLLIDVLAKYLIPEGQSWDAKRLQEEAAKAGVEHVQFVGADGDDSIGFFGSSLPIEWALDPNKEVILAYEINGVPLSRDQGYPLRVIVPGSIGARQVKWLKQIILSKEESPSYWFSEDYKLVTPSQDTDVDLKKLPAIMEFPVQSAICSPADGCTIRNEGVVSVSGYAFSGGGRGILSVRVSADGGNTWYEAELQPVSSPESIDPSTISDGDLAFAHRNSRQWAWTLWRVDIPIDDTVTDLELVCYARDSSNAVQPENCKATMNVRGLLTNSWHRINVKVRPADL